MSRGRLNYLFGFLWLQVLAVAGGVHAQPVSFFLSGEFGAASPSVLINNTQRAGRPMLTVNPDVVPVGGPVTATWSGIATPTSTDWIGLYVPGTSSTDFIDWIYVSCSKSPGSGQANGSCPVVVPASVNPGDYELRLLANDGFTRLARSKEFTITGAGGPMLTVSPGVVSVGSAVTAAWLGIAGPTSTDWIGLYVPGAPNTAYINWIYVSCSKTPGSAQANGSCPLVVPVSANPGDYELRLLANDGFNLVATSTAFTVLSWCEPVNLGATINSASNDQYPSITPNGLSLYFESNRPGGEGGIDLWVSQRQSVDSPWETPENLGSSINSTADERGANFTPDGLTMYFSSARPGGYGALDFYVTTRTDPNDDFGWGPVQNLGEPINTAANETGGVFQLDAAGDITHFYFIRDPALDEDFDIYVTVPDHWGGWKTPVPVVELNSSGFRDTKPSVTRDGLEMFLSSARPGGFGQSDLYVSTRARITDPWGEPVNLGGVVNTSVREENGTLDVGDPTENTIYFFSTRPGGFGITDIYVTTRTCP